MGMKSDRNNPRNEKVYPWLRHLDEVHTEAYARPSILKQSSEVKEHFTVAQIDGLAGVSGMKCDRNNPRTVKLIHGLQHRDEVHTKLSNQKEFPMTYTITFFYLSTLHRLAPRLASFPIII